MSQYLARDSAIWWLVIIGALFTYMANEPPPTQWHYGDWMRFGAFLAATVGAKLSTSPLASINEMTSGVRTLLGRRP